MKVSPLVELLFFFFFEVRGLSLLSPSPLGGPRGLDGRRFRRRQIGRAHQLPRGCQKGYKGRTEKSPGRVGGKGGGRGLPAGGRVGQLGPLLSVLLQGRRRQQQQELQQSPAVSSSRPAQPLHSVSFTSLRSPTADPRPHLALVSTSTTTPPSSSTSLPGVTPRTAGSRFPCGRSGPSPPPSALRGDFRFFSCFSKLFL